MQDKGVMGVMGSNGGIFRFHPLNYHQKCKITGRGLMGSRFI